ncbi:chemotaxis protein CheW [Salicibibacter cibarius]|uniref:Chemotaxis protein CheW n=1 Tax=Salicibibacter cibarius TaxID=2743000 RepID=A0A7T6Z644_9BACI|nr:chemotaxis protein CheW [Salicibibacter cibarius]QQK77081.1 chemotaxis protein CheW [Salicibibacter cibarius]
MTTDTAQWKIVIFELQGEEYGLEVSRVQSIERMLPLTRVPGAPRPDIAGVMNLRGKITPVIDLRLCLGVEAPPYDKQTRILVVVGNDSAVCLIVDRANDLLNINETEIEEIPAAHENETYGFFQGVVKIDQRMITLLEIDQVLQ